MESGYHWTANRALPADRVVRGWQFKFSKVDAWGRAGGANELADKAAS